MISDEEIANLEIGGRYLTNESHRIALEALLLESSTATAWPVHFIIQDLRNCWAYG